METKIISDQVINILEDAKNKIAALTNNQLWSAEWAEQKLHFLIKEIKEGREIND